MTSSVRKLSRSAAQIAASKANGAKGHGPTTPGGLLASSANSLKHGLFSKAFVGPGGDVASVRTMFEEWVHAYGITSPAAHHLAARGAAVTLQLDRVADVRAKMLFELLEERVAHNEPATDLERVRKIQENVSALASLADDIQAPVPRPEAAKLLPALRDVVQCVLEVPVAIGVGYGLAACVGFIDDDGIDDIEVEVFAAIAENCREILKAIDPAIPEMNRRVEIERARQEELLVIADDKRLREVDKVRARLIKEVESIARALLAIRELEMKNDAHEGVDPAVLPPIEFKVVGAPR